MRVKGKILFVDPGNRYIRTGILDFLKDGAPDLVFIKSYDAAGMNNGTVSSRKEFATALRKAIENARNESGVETFGEVWVGHSGQHIRSDNVTEESKLRHNAPVTSRLEKVMMKRAELHIPPDSQLLHSFQQFSSLDGVRMSSASGLLGTNLLSRYHLVFSRKDIINNLRAAFRDAGITPTRFLFNGYIASLAVSQAEEMNLGCLVIHLGHSTVDYIVYQEGQPFITGSLNDGWQRVTRDVAMGISLTMDNAEKIMKSVGVAHDIDANEDGPLNITNLFGEASQITRRQLAVIMSATIEEIFTLVRDQIKNSICRGHLPGGVYLTGGGAMTRGITYSAMGVFSVPTRVEFPMLPWGNKEYEPGWATIIGMAKEASERVFPVKVPEKVSSRLGLMISDFSRRMFPKSRHKSDPEGEPEA